MAGQADGGVDRGRDALLRALSDGGVRFVLIGGAAIESHGVDYATQDIDVTPDREHENLERLATVLNGLDRRLELDPEDPKRRSPGSRPVGVCTPFSHPGLLCDMRLSGSTMPGSAPPSTSPAPASLTQTSIHWFVGTGIVLAVIGGVGGMVRTLRAPDGTGLPIYEVEAALVLGCLVAYLLAMLLSLP